MLRFNRRYIYQLEYTDSIDTPHINKTQVVGFNVITESEAKELLTEQLKENNIHPDWIKVISYRQVSQ